MSSFSIPGQVECRSLQARIDHAIEHLKSLHDGEAGFTEVVSLGAATIPSLRLLLFERERSGLHQARCRAAEALAAFKAFDVLAEFLRMGRTITDPVERLGEEAVMSTAGRSIARLREEWVYRLLAEFAAHRGLGGVLTGLGSFGRKESIPTFVNALAEDDVRMTAEAMLRIFGNAARPALTAAALDRGDDAQSESESHLRKRRSCLGLLVDIGICRRHWPSLRSLMDDHDHQIALLACEACLNLGAQKDLARLRSRLADLRTTAAWFDRERIDELLRLPRENVSKDEPKP